MSSSKIGDIFMQYLNLTSSPTHDVKNRFSIRQPSLAENEAEFLKIVREGESQELLYFLQRNPEINFNCCDCRGLRALEIAVLEHDEEVAEMLLTMGTFSISHLHGAAIQAVVENEPKILQGIIDSCDKINGEGPKPGQLEEVDSACTSWGFRNMCAPGMTPIVAAAMHGNLEITQLLLARGHYVPKPHHPTCKCMNCQHRALDLERLSESIARINHYKALASPVYIILTSDDPILTAFELSVELLELSSDVPEHQGILIDLAKQCSRFAADLLDTCCDTREVQTVLTQKKGYPDPRPKKFSRLHLAVHYGQKEFVTHPSCQQVVRSMWVEGQSQWWRWSPARRCMHVVKHMFLFPLLSLVYIVFPVPFVLRQLMVPLNRFIHAATSYLVFLALILATLSCGKSHDANSSTQNIETVIGVYVFAYFWEITVNMYLLGVKQCFRSWWSVYDFIMFSLFLISQFLWLSAYILRREEYDTFPMERNEWPWYHPYLIGEGTFAVSAILAFLRLMLWYQMHDKLGPLSTSLRYMVGDVFRFLLIMMIIMFAFATGINSLYRNYEGNVMYGSDGISKKQPDDFVNLRSTYKNVFWAIFGLGNPESADLVVAGNSSYNQTVPHHEYTEFLGYSLWAVYHLTTVIVLINMLVAMLTDSFQRVNDNSDTEWKFARSSLWLAFLDSQSILAPPFNLIPTACGIKAFVGCLVSCVRGRFESNYAALQKCCFWDTESQRASQKLQEESYQQLLVHMIHRYLQCKDRQESSSSRLAPESLGKLKTDIMTDFRKSIRKTRRKKKKLEMAL